MNDDEEGKPWRQIRDGGISSVIKRGQATIPTDPGDEYGLRHLADLYGAIEATLRGLANDPGQLAEPTRSDLLLRIARELRHCRQDIAQTEHFLANLALAAMSDELGRR